MKQSKKGITLVELVICCAILVLLGGACTAVLVSGQTVFNTSSKTANAQLDADVLQTYLMNLLPPAKNIKYDTLANAKALTGGKAIFFDDGDHFTLRVDGKDTTISSITGFKYTIERAGEKRTETDPTGATIEVETGARAQLQYTITLSDGSEIKSGFVLANVKYAGTLPGASGEKDLKDSPIIFDLPPESESPAGGST